METARQEFNAKAPRREDAKKRRKMCKNSAKTLSCEMRDYGPLRWEGRQNSGGSLAIDDAVNNVSDETWS
jgi:hypothetical protein